VNTFKVTEAIELKVNAFGVGAVRNVMGQIVRNGKVTRACMEIYIQGVSPELAKAFGEGVPRGALVGDVEPGDPGEEGGLKKGDTVAALNATDFGIQDMEFCKTPFP